MKTTDPDNPDEFRPDDTVAMRLRAKAQESRATRETLGNTTGVGGAGLVLWLANLAGVDMPPDTAVFIGSLLSTVISSLVRKRLSK